MKLHITEITVQPLDSVNAVPKHNVTGVVVVRCHAQDASLPATGAGAILIQDLLGVSCMSPSSRVTSIRSSTRQKTHDLMSYHNLEHSQKPCEKSALGISCC